MAAPRFYFLTDSKRGFKWHPRYLELLHYFKDHPFFSVRYKRTASCLYEREDFIAICNKAALDLDRLKHLVRQKMNNIILIYAKLNLLISSGEILEEQVLNHRCTGAYLKGELDFLKVFVSGFTDGDIPQPIHDYYDNLFKVNVLTRIRAQDVTPVMTLPAPPVIKQKSKKKHKKDTQYERQSSDIRLFEYFKDHPYFSVKYERTYQCFYEREDFNDICNKAGEDQCRNKGKVRVIMTNVILKYAKLNLLISSGQVTEEMIQNHPCTSDFLKGKLDFLKVFVSGFTDADIPDCIHECYDNFFKVRFYAEPNTGVTFEHVSMYINSLERHNENDLHSMDMIFINSIIRQAFIGTYDEEGTGYETKMFKDLGLDNYEVVKESCKDTTSRVAVEEAKFSICPNINIKKKITDSNPDTGDNSFSDTVVEGSLRNNISTFTSVATPQKFTFSASPIISIETKINENDKVNAVSVLHGNEENNSTNIISANNVAETETMSSVLPNANTKKNIEIDLHNMDMIFINSIIRQAFIGAYDEEGTGYVTKMFKALGLDNYEVVIESCKDTTSRVAVEKAKHSMFPNINIKKKITDSNKDTVENSFSDTVVEGSLRNDIFTCTSVATPEQLTCSASPIKGIKTKINDSDKVNVVSVLDGNEENNSTNIIPANNVAETETMSSVLPNVNTKNNNEDSGIFGHGVSDGEDALINTIPNVTSGVDISKYMQDIAEYLCQRLPMDERRGFLNQVELIVFKVLQE